MNYLVMAMLPLCLTTANPAPQPLALDPLPLGAIRPEGWLENQLRIQANGLTGHLDEFWPDIRDSGWIGGEAEGWERAPYWLDGLVPLAYLLDDPVLKGKAERWVNYILDHQHEDGWFGPLHGERDGKVAKHTYDPWPTFILLKVLVQYQEATGDPRVIPALQRYADKLKTVLEETPLFEWGQYRWMDGAAMILWLHQKTGDDSLLEVAQLLQQQGFDWMAHYRDFPFTEKMDRGKTSLTTHVVNNAMGLKAPGISYRIGGGDTAKDAAYAAFQNLDRYHGQVTGVFAGDEHFAGLNPSQGTELCAVVEYLYSLEHLLAVFGDPAFGDRLERIAFNALPATFKPDMWAHQYDQQVNQVISCVAPDPIYTTNGPDANLFGLEPNYGCCTSNMHQGWPKFTAHLWMATPDGGLAAVAYAPCTVNTKIGGVDVTITVKTAYPFRDMVDITVHTSAPVTFPLLLRVPGWVETASIEVTPDAPDGAAPGSFFRYDAAWQGEKTLRLKFPMKVKMEFRYHDSVAITRGPLVYSLKMAEDWRQLRGELPHADWEVHPASPWNYALALNPGDPDKDVRFEERPVGPTPFSPEGAPVVAQVRGRQVPEWTLEKSAAGPLPQSPVISNEPEVDLTLIPYGCTNLRVTEFPWLRAP